MKAIIPVAGAGTKLRPHTYTQPKALIPLAGKTILSINVDQLHDAGINEFVFIVGYLGEKIQDYIKAKYPDLNCHFIYQNVRKGTGHAINLAKQIIGNDDVFIALGDTICEYDIDCVLQSPYSMLGVKKVDDPSNFGVAEIDNDEFNLTDALECMIQSGAKLKPFKVENWFDCGKKESLLKSNATLLKKFGGTIAESNTFENTIFIPPVSIAEGCDIRNSIVGPNVAMGENTIVHYSIVKDSIVGSFSKLYDVVLDDSLIGSDAEIRGETRSLNIGDNTEIDLGS